MRQSGAMESSLPFAVRVAAGLLSEAVGRARRLPADLTTLPVSVIGQVAKFSFELNQQLAELATEGDRLLAGLRGGDDEPPQRTAWSTIDDEDEVAAKDPQAAATWDSPAAGATPGAAADRTRTADVTDIRAGAPGLVLDDDAPVAPRATGLVPDEDAPSPSRRSTVRRPRTGGTAGTRVGAGSSAGSVVGGTGPDGRTTRRPARGARTTGPDVTADTVTPLPMDRALLEDVEELEVDRPAPPVQIPAAATPSVDTPVDPLVSDPALTDATTEPATGAAIDIAAMTVAQLRSQVRSWNAGQVREALEQEQRGKARPAFLTVLTNRLSTLARGGA